jgi:pyruvate dehydrogenase E2 component (dihydrolipoamide acetyltransferase)
VQPPTVAILGAGRVREEVVARGGAPAVRPILPLSLTFDHRAVTGGEATRFLAAVIADLEAA